MSEHTGRLPGMPEGQRYAEPGWESPDPEACYDFDIFGVWIIDGKAYVGEDSGCSCPSPWEDHTTIDSLTGPLSWTEVMAAYNEHVLQYHRRDDAASINQELVAAGPKLGQWLVDNGI